MGARLKPAVPVGPGQRWALRDYRYEGWRYLTVESADDATVVARSRRRVTWQADRFGRGSRFVYCGYDGPGILPPYLGSRIGGCGSCPPAPAVMPLETPLDPGFGWVTVTRDGSVVWSGSTTRKRLAHFEVKAREADGDWRLRLELPMREALYQRHGPSRWVLVAVGMGFA